jgi:hypothetical protein
LITETEFIRAFCQTRFKKSETEVGLRAAEISLRLEEEPEYSVDLFRLFKLERFCITELEERQQRAKSK